MPPDGQALTLGALFHDLRDGLADRGHVRVLIEFRSESVTTPSGVGGGSQLAVRRGFRAEFDHRDEVLEDARLVWTGMSPRPVAEIFVAHHADRHLYSTDGVRFGPLRDTPRLFDLYSFESRLRRVAVGTVAEESDPQPHGPPGRILRPALDAVAYQSLVRLFGDAPGDMSESLDMSGCSAAMTASSSVGIHYRWQTTGEDLVEDRGGRPDRYLTRHRSRVTVQLSQQPGRENGWPGAHAESVTVDTSLPLLGGVDDVWAAIRRARAAPGEPAMLDPAAG